MDDLKDKLAEYSEAAEIRTKARKALEDVFLRMDREDHRVLVVVVQSAWARREEHG